MTRLALKAAIALSFALTAQGPTQAGGAVEVSKRVEADGTHTLIHQVTVDAPAADVWAAIATPEGWMGWAVPIAWVPEGQPDILETSYDPAAKPGDPGNIQQQFLARIPGKSLAFRTIKTPEGFPHREAYLLVSSLFELEPAGPGRTRVRLTSTNYPAGEAGAQLVSFFERGNAMTLEWLKARFTDGPTDWAKRLGGNP